MHAAGRLLVRRSIPACAGEPESSTPAPSSARVYPRVCGGTSVVGCGRGVAIGLSPRVRGNRLLRERRALQRRSIPACAGEPRQIELSVLAWRVYPRVCGGTSEWEIAGEPWQGLSPRVRGNRDGGIYTRYSHGSIPACAGEPCLDGIGPIPAGVYPRVCGGTPPFARCACVNWGLSPRVRGNLFGVLVWIEVRGSIPACAGEPDRGAEHAASAAVYPRVCGGTTPCRAECHHHQRSIPACAGEPAYDSPSTHATKVYPRVCGGTTVARLSNDCVGGLSPRVRGNPAICPAGNVWRRSIPACAGEPAVTDAAENT